MKRTERPSSLRTMTRSSERPSGRSSIRSDARYACPLFCVIPIHSFILCAQEAEARGEDFDRVKFMDTPAEEADKIGRKKRNADPDQGFSGMSVIKPSTTHDYSRLQQTTHKRTFASIPG